MQKKIAVLPGDGIGPEVVEQGIKVLKAVGERFSVKFNYEYADIGAVAIDNTDNPLPDSTIDTCLGADAILMGAIGDPKYDNNPNATVRPEQGLLKLRKSLGLFANIRPITTYKSLAHISPLKEEKVQDVDFVVFRELTGGIYFGEKGRKDDGDTAFDICSYSKSEIDRIARLAFESARQRSKRLTLVDKANVLETSRLWRDTVGKIAEDYTDVKVEYMFVDNAAMQIIMNPKQFDVILTENMFGDIITDEASMITGSIGLLPSASIGTSSALFEPIHGSYPQAKGKGIANPIATILSVAMLLDSLSLVDAGIAVREATEKVLNNGIMTPDLNETHHYTTAYVGDMIVSAIKNEESEGFKPENISVGMSTII